MLMHDRQNGSSFKFIIRAGCSLLPLQQLSSNNISSSSANIANADKAQHLSTSVDHDQREDQEESTPDPVTSITRPRLTCW